jgi:hypothetical protein
MLGEDLHALRNIDAVSPKLRVPAHNYVFEDFADANPLEANNFVAVGSLAKGGLSNAWGCGVARLSTQELADFPFAPADLDHSYERITRRIGVSGASHDDLSDYFGLDAWSQPPIPMDGLHQQIFTRYSAQKWRLRTMDFRLGRSRVAALSEDYQGRKACERSGNCLWGCHRKALYSSTDEISALTRYENFHYQGGFVVDNIDSGNVPISIQGQYQQRYRTATAKKVILAAGTLATTRLALLAIGSQAAIPLQSCPAAAFLLWLPRLLGTPRSNGFGLGQLSFSLQVSDDIAGFGSTFPTTGIPVSEFVRHVPLSRRYGIDILKYLLSSCLVGNIFLPGHLSTTRVALNTRGALNIEGGHSDRVQQLMIDAASKLRRAYWQLDAVLLPKSFTVGRPGGDIHYSGTLPMRRRPRIGETNVLGEIAGVANAHVVDGACLPTLSEKSHTLTIMANADRIGRALAAQVMPS